MAEMQVGPADAQDTLIAEYDAEKGALRLSIIAHPEVPGAKVRGVTAWMTPDEAAAFTSMVAGELPA